MQGFTNGMNMLCPQFFEGVMCNRQYDGVIGGYIRLIRQSDAIFRLRLRGVHPGNVHIHLALVVFKLADDVDHAGVA